MLLVGKPAGESNCHDRCLSFTQEAFRALYPQMHEILVRRFSDHRPKLACEVAGAEARDRRYGYEINRIP